MFLQAVSHFISSELLSILFSTPIQLYKTNKLDYFSLCNIYAIRTAVSANTQRSVPGQPAHTHKYVVGGGRSSRWWAGWCHDAMMMWMQPNCRACNTDALHKRQTDHTTTLLFKLQSDTFVPADREFAIGFSSLHTECRWLPGWLG